MSKSILNKIVASYISLIAKSPEEISKNLPKYPWWEEGHSRFALHHLESLKVCPREQQGRSVASMRASALALELLSPAGKSFKSEFFNACVAFYQKDYPRALSSFEQLMKQPSPNTTFFNLLHEYAGASAIAVGEGQKAQEFLKRISVNERSSEVEEVLKSLAANN